MDKQQLQTLIPDRYSDELPELPDGVAVIHKELFTDGMLKVIIEYEDNVVADTEAHLWIERLLSPDWGEK